MKLLIALQHWDGDAEEAEDLLRLLCDLQQGKTQLAALALVTRSRQRLLRRDLVELAKTKFAAVYEHRMPRDTQGWPGGCNVLAVDTLHWMAMQHSLDTSLDGCFLMEPDCCPTSQNWLAELHAEWTDVRRNGKMILGNVLPDGAGRMHVNGSAVFAWDISYKVAALGNTPLNWGWDCWHAATFLRIAQPSKLMVLDYKKPTVTAEEFFAYRKDGNRPSIVHGVKDGSARVIVRNAFVGQPQSERVDPATFFPPRHAYSAEQAPAGTFRHTGDMGDVIAFLPVLRAHGSAQLFISDRQAPGHMVTQAVKHRWGGGRLEALMPLLRSLPYLKDVQFTGAPAQYDVQRFRVPQFIKPGRHLGTSQAMFCQLPGDWSTPWIEVEPDPRTAGKVVIHRSSRYHNPLFPWAKIIESLGNSAVFVGLNQEYVDFCTAVGRRIDFISSGSLLETAKLIKGADMLVTNQTCVFWIGEAVKARLLLEVANLPYSYDCVIPRADSWNFHAASHFSLEKVDGLWTPVIGQSLTYQQKALDALHRLAESISTPVDVELFLKRREACSNCHLRTGENPDEDAFYAEGLATMDTSRIMPPHHRILSGYCQHDHARLDEKIRMGKGFSCIK